MSSPKAMISSTGIDDILGWKSSKVKLPEREKADILFIPLNLALLCLGETMERSGGWDEVIFAAC